ncbi:protein cereblon-like isoform X1 [Hordeum vulgare subsp. vulgare]|uniref:Protein cereblon n=1 Tax=Hordeum vulgare subsp. vulgare TaxID=112509 RepID=A0A8I6WSR7_HORVV|nr:protein cereblon-like isoform X1 [Hordeum vulgare subsp. vulgare]
MEADWDRMVLQVDMEDLERAELDALVVDEHRHERFEREWEQMEDQIYRQVLAIGSFARLDDGGGRGEFGHQTALHTYLGEVDDIPGRKATLLDAGSIISLPMLFLHGVVLFPGATLPLKLIEARFVGAVEKALRHVDAPETIGVVLMHGRPNHRNYANASVGTTAEIRQLGRSEDGSVNVKARGQQRFRLIRYWADVDGVVWGEVQIIEEDPPLRTPRAAFAQLGASRSYRPHTSSQVMSLDVSPIKQQGHIYSDPDCDTPTSSDSSSQSSNSVKPYVSGQSGKNTNMDEEEYICSTPSSARTHVKHQYNAGNYSKQPLQASLAFWPQWAYEMHDPYALACRAADLWRLIIKTPNVDELVRKPDLLSFYIGNQLPVSEPVRQKLLEINGVSYRLRKEIQLLKACDLIKCGYCKSEIAKHSDVVVMSSDGPLGTYVNNHGYVHATITVNNATGLDIEGDPTEEHSWFPGYAWTIASCSSCDSNIGWLFTATKRYLHPKFFWGIRSCQIADIVDAGQQQEE